VELSPVVTRSPGATGGVVVAGWVVVSSVAGVSPSTSLVWPEDGVLVVWAATGPARSATKAVAVRRRVMVMSVPFRLRPPTSVELRRLIGAANAGCP
jgi:hypothetical protein